MRKPLEELIEDLRRNEFHVDCTRIELVRASDGKRFVGPGYIRQNPARNFDIKIYVEGKLDFHLFAKELTAPKPAGVLFDESDHFSMTATDDMCRQWTAERIVKPQQGGHTEGTGHIVTAGAYEIVLTERRHSRETGNWIHLRSFENVEFPCNTHTNEVIEVGTARSSHRSSFNAAVLASNGFDFLVENLGGLSVQASAEELSLSPVFEERVSEAIVFALGTWPKWVALTRSQGTETSTRFRWTTERREHARPPYRIDLLDETGSTWRMFDLYLAFVLKDEAHYVHELSPRLLHFTPSGGGGDVLQEHLSDGRG